MKYIPTIALEVFYDASPTKTLRVGRIASAQRSTVFEYDANFLNTGLQLSPFMLPLKPGVTACTDRTFNGLFGLFNDSLPDGWGCLLLDRLLLKKGIMPTVLTPLDRLAYVGHAGMGALSYVPSFEEGYVAQDPDLDTIAQEVNEVLEKDTDTFVEDLLKIAGSSAGARPKIMARIEGKEYLIKFAALVDGADSGAVEYAYHLMAKAAGLNVPEAKLFPAKKGSGFFGVERFDRIAQAGRVHTQTISALLHVDHRVPSMDYLDVLRLTSRLTQSAQEVRQQFRAAVFNILSHNRDDHAKNFSFVMNADGQWSVSPAYDLTFSSGPGGEHSTTCMGFGKNISNEVLKALAAKFGIGPKDAAAIIDQVKEAIGQWAEHADRARLSRNTTQAIGSILKNLIG